MNYYGLILKLSRIYGSLPGSVPFLNGYALPPLFIVLELTYRCNLACPYCYIDPAAQPGNRAPELSAAEIENIIDQTPPWTLVLLSGGEILIRDDFDRILRKIVQKRRCHVFTNGMLLTNEIAREWVGLGLSSVGVSIDGPENVHDALRGPGTFSRAASAIRRIAEARKHEGKEFPLINLKTTITSENVRHLTETIRLAEEIGADYCTFQILNHSKHFGGAALQNHMAYHKPPAHAPDFPTDVLSAQLQAMRGMTKTRVQVRILPDLPVSFILDHYANRLDPRTCNCISPWTVMYVSPYGDIYLCLNYRVGNLREHSMKELWNCSRYRQFRRQLQRRSLFPDCSGCCDLLPKRRIFRRKPVTGNVNGS